ncbi:hypothetical protein [Capnocytophaga sp.]|uniref:hypothetical protein n=1 Tax=Capnocytophaga sp. TaxID=44737 RepID=UPI0026DABDD3|nr:hypothetical protein [Capnocytophaga sp.]MDO5104473.1 hypothetical protein [Capnocytophaga sp.]
MKHIFLFIAVMMAVFVNAQINVTYQDNENSSIKPFENFSVNISDYRTAHELLGLIGNRLYAFPLNKDYDYRYSTFSIKFLTRKGKKEEYRVIDKEEYETLLAGKYVEVEDIAFGGTKKISAEEWDKKNRLRNVTFLDDVEIYATEKSTGNKFIINGSKIKHFVAEKYFENMKSKYLGKQFLNNRLLKYKIPKESYERIYDMTYLQPKPIEKEDVVKAISIDFIYNSLPYPSLIVKFDNSKELMLDTFLFKSDYMDLEEYKNFYDAYSAYKEARIKEGKLNQKAREEEWEKEREREKAEKHARLKKKYGDSVAKDMANGYVRIGWSKQMCIDSWGKPESINKTTTQYSVSEQWVYGNGNYLYFENGKLTAIQN